MKGSEFLDQYVKQVISDIHTLMPARIEDYDPVTLEAEVQPLFMQKFKDQDPVEMPLIVKVPVMPLIAGGFVIRPPYEEDDIVLVGFTERALDEVINTGEGALPASKRRHALDDAVVLGGLNPFNNALPAEHGDNLIIGLIDEDNPGEWRTRIAIDKTTGHIILEWGVDDDEKTRAEIGEDIIKLEFHPGQDDEKIIELDSQRLLAQFEDMGEIEINDDPKIIIKSEGDTDIEVEGTANIVAQNLVSILAPLIQLAGGGKGVARIGDEVEITIPSGSSAGTYTGVITEGSEVVESG